jgi:tetratricopeptide (TPR) repeat protein
MPRFSAKAKEILDETDHDLDLVKLNTLLEELEDPLDIAFGKLFVAYQYVIYPKQYDFLEILTEVENENKILKDSFIQFLLNVYYCVYYMGVNVPTRSKEQAEVYLGNIEQSYQNLDYWDDWEKYYCIERYYWVKALYSAKFEDYSNAIELQKKCIDAESKIPEDGEYYSIKGYHNLGHYYKQIGDFEEAEKVYYLIYDRTKASSSIIRINTLNQLADLKSMQGDLTKAKELDMQALNFAKQVNNIYWILICLTCIGDHLYQEGDYDGAITSHLESLVYRKQHDEPLQIFNGHFKIFDYYYQRFKMTNDNAFLKQAKQSLIDLQELSRTHSDIKSVVNFTNYAHSLVLKHGNMRQKVMALDILEDLVKIYPYDGPYHDPHIGISLNLLELLFEDVLQSEDQDTINQIDELMVAISKVPLRNNPQSIFGYISQQIFLAKYNYYIKGDPSQAFDILEKAKEHINHFKLESLVSELDAEIQILEREFSKWNNLNVSIKERIKSSEFNKYILEALKVMDKQMS